MADEPSRSSYEGFGLTNQVPDEPVPTRGVGGYLKDVAIDTGRGVLGVARDLGGLREMGAVSPEQRAQARADMDELSKLNWQLGQAKSEAGRYRDVHPEAKTWLDVGTDVATGILPVAPLAATGPAAPAVFGGLALGHQRVELRDQLRDASDDQVVTAAQRAGVDQTGKSIDQLRDELYTIGTDPTKLETWKAAAPAVLGNVIGGGAASLLTKGVMRTLTGTITDNVLARVNQGTGVGNFIGRRIIGGAEGAIGGGAMMAGSEATRQLTEQQAGLRTGIDTGAIWGAGGEGAATFGAVGALLHRRQPGPKAAPPIGTDTFTTAMAEEMAPGRDVPRVGQEFDRSLIPLEAEYGAADTGARLPGPRWLPDTTTGDAARPMVARDIAQPGEAGGEAPAPFATEPGTYRTPYSGIGDIQRGPRTRAFRGPGVPVPELQPRPEEPPPRGPSGGGPWRTPEQPLAPQFPEIEPFDPRFPPEEPPAPPAPPPGGAPRPFPEGGEIPSAFVPPRGPPRGGGGAGGAGGPPRGGARPRGGAAPAAAPVAVPETLSEHLAGLAETPTMFGAEPTSHVISRVMERGTPAEHAEWANAMEKTGGTWARMPASWRRAVKGMEGAVNDVVRRNPRAVIDQLRYTAARETPAEAAPREAAAAEQQPPTREAPRGEEPSRQEVEGQAEYEAYQEPHGQQEPPSEFGPEWPAGERPPRRARVRERPRVTPGDLGLVSRRGAPPETGLGRIEARFSPELRLRMQQRMGMRLQGTGEQMRAGMGRLAPEPPLQRRFAFTEQGVRGAKGPTYGLAVEEGEPQWVPPEATVVDRLALERTQARRAALKAQRAATERAEGMARQQRAEATDRIVEMHELLSDLGAAHDWVGNMFKDTRQILNDSRTVQTIARREADIAKEQDRKRGRTRSDYDARERTLRQVAEGLSNQIDRIPVNFFEEHPIERGRTITMREYLDELFRPAGVVRLRSTEERPLTIGEAHELPLDKLSRTDLVAAARRMAALYTYHVNNAQAALNELKRLRYDVVPGGKRPQISFSIGTRTSGLHPWYDVMADFKRRAALLIKAAENVHRGRGGLDTVNTLRNQMYGAFLRQRLLAEGRLAELRELNRTTQSMLYGDMQADLLKQQNKISDYERAEQNRASLVQQLAEAGKDTQRGAEIQASITQLDERMKKMGVDAARKRIDEIIKARAAMEEIQGASARQIADFADQIHDWIDERSVQDHQRMAMLEFYRDKYGTDRLPYPEQVQLRRERARGSMDIAEQAARDAGRTEQQIETARREISAEEAAPRPTQAEARERLAANNSRIDELLYARNLIPDNIPTGEVRSLIDTLRYYLRTPENPMNMTQPQKTRARLDEMIRQVDDEIASLQDNSRQMFEAITPEARQWDYRVGGVLDPAANLREGHLATPEQLQQARERERAGTREVPRPTGRVRAPPLPVGASVHRLSDFLDPNNPRSIRPPDNTTEGRLRNHLFNIVSRVAGDVDVVALTPEQYRLVREQRGLLEDHPAFYDQETHRIITTRDVINGADRSRILGHEFFHPLTVAAAERFPDVTRRLDTIRKQVLDAYMERSHSLLGGERALNDVQRILGDQTQGLHNVHEFISELYNDDGRLMSALKSMPVTPELRRALGTEQRRTFLDRVVGIMRDGLMRLFMQFNKNKLANDAVLHTLDMFYQAGQVGRMRPTARAEVHPFTMEEAGDTARSMIDRAKYMWDQRGGPSGNFLRWHDLNQLGRRAEAGFQHVVAPFERLVNQVYTTTRHIIEKSGMEGMLKRLSAMSRLPAERWKEFNDFINDENYHGANAAMPLHEGENAWVSRDAQGHQQMRDNHAGLQRRYEALSPEMKAMRQELLDFARKRHDELLQANINRAIDAKGYDPAMKDAIYRHIMDDAPSPYGEDAKFKKWVDEVRSIPQFKKLPGVWYPMLRRGNWVTEGVFNLAKHAKAVSPDAREISRGEWQFETAAQRDEFLRRVAADDAMKGVKLMRVREVGYSPDLSTRVKRGTGDAVDRYRAEYNPLLLEFHGSKFAAAQRRADLVAKYGDNIEMTHTEPVKDRNGDYLPQTRATAAMEKMLTSLQHSEGWENMTPVERAQMERDLKDASIRYVMANTARATYLPRKYALGADKDLIKNYLQYGNNTARTLAEVQHADELRRQVKVLDEYVEGRKKSGSPGDPEGRYGTLRRQIQNQIHSVLAESPDPNLQPVWKKALGRALQVSYIDRLLSPSFLLLNASEPWVLGAPLLTGRHGLKAIRELGRAYNTIGAHKLWGKGLVDFTKVAKDAFTGDMSELSDNIGLLRDAIKGQADEAALNKLFDYVDQHGYFDRNAGMELEQLFNPDATKLGRVADHVDNAFRQVNNQVENVNRAVTAIASYRLGILDGMTHEQAMEHAKNMMHDVNGNYAAHASPAVFRHPWLKPALQFKRYAHRIISNYVRLLATSFGRNVSGADRAVALKQLGAWTAAQIAVSGMIGLPTEPLKVVINGLHLAGLIDWNYDDAEYMARNMASDALGPELGMALSRGVLRNLGLGIGTRMGYDSLVTSGNIETWKEAPGALFKLFGGSPADMLMTGGEGITAGIRGLINWSQGFDSQADRDLGEFVEKGIPIKAANDVYRAWSQAVGGRKSETKGGQPLGYDPSWLETGLAAAGIRSKREAEASDLRKEFYTKQKRYNDEKNRLLDAFAMAETEPERARVMRYVTETFNPSQPAELKLGVHQLMQARSRREQRGQQPAEYMGLPINKRTRALLPRPDVYNVQ